MKTKQLIVLAIASMLIQQGCNKRPPEAPFITDISDTKVEVTANHSGKGNALFGDWPTQSQMLEVANEGCRMNQGKAVALSYKCTVYDKYKYTCMQRAFLYACKEDAEAKKAKMEETCAQVAIGNKEQWDAESDKSYEDCMREIMIKGG